MPELDTINKISEKLLASVVRFSEDSIIITTIEKKHRGSL